MYDEQVLGDAIPEKVELIDRLSAEVATSAGAWLRDRAGMTGAAAKALTRTASRGATTIGKA